VRKLIWHQNWCQIGAKLGPILVGKLFWCQIGVNIGAKIDLASKLVSNWG